MLDVGRPLAIGAICFVCVAACATNSDPSHSGDPDAASSDAAAELPFEPAADAASDTTGPDSEPAPPVCRAAPAQTVAARGVGDFQHTVFTLHEDDASSRTTVIIRSDRDQRVDGPGTYAVDAAGLGECSVCVLVEDGCTGSTCERSYVSEAGAIEIHELDRIAGRFSATLRGIELQQSHIQRSTFTSFPVEGEAICLEDLAFAGELEVGYSDDCIATRGTYNVACAPDPIPELELQRCSDASFTTIHELMGDKALWLIISAGWCPSCPDDVQTLAERVASETGLAGAVVLREDYYGYIPGFEFCTSYVARTGGNADWYYLIVDNRQDPLYRIYTPAIGYPLSILARAGDRRMHFVERYSLGFLNDELAAMLAAESAE